MKSAGKARNNGLYRHIRTSKEIIRNLLNDYVNNKIRIIIPFAKMLFKGSRYDLIVFNYKYLLHSFTFICILTRIRQLVDIKQKSARYKTILPYTAPK